jgi:hypothetical protein
MLMGEYYSTVMFFNFKTWHINMLQLGKGLLYGCFPFQLTFATEKKKHISSLHQKIIL